MRCSSMRRARAACAQRGWLLRRDCQFHWRNRGYAQLRGLPRDLHRREAQEGAARAAPGRRGRHRLRDPHGRRARRARCWIAVYELHRDTFLRHGHEPYLTRAFFSEIARTLPRLADGEAGACTRRAVVAAAIFFVGADALFGRYWGAAADYHSLHFETCYHQGIEFCIERGLQRFEPGTQGEHKVSRGFEPTLTWSAHYIADAQFRAAIARLPRPRGRGGGSLCARGPGRTCPFRGRRERRPPAVRTITWLSPHDAPEWFPPPEQALEEPAGLLAAGGDLSPQRLLAAYRRGIFPWYSPGQPVLWWSPDPRAVLFPEEFHLLAEPRQDAAQRRLRVLAWTATSRRSSRAARRRATPARAPGSPRKCAPPTCSCTAWGIAHSIEIWRDGTPGRGPVRGAAGRGVLRRVDVQPRARCLQGGAGPPGRGVPAQRPRGDRLPAALAAPGEPGRPHHPARTVPGPADRARPGAAQPARRPVTQPAGRA